MKRHGIQIPGFKITQDGKIAEDAVAKRKRLSVNKQIAAREGAKNKVKFVRKNHGAR